MTNNQKMLLGVGAVAVVGYLLWKRQQTAFTGKLNATGSKLAVPKCPYCTTNCTPAGPLHPQGLCTNLTTSGIYTVANVYDCGNCKQGPIANTVYTNMDTTTSTHWFPGTPLGGKK